MTIINSVGNTNILLGQSILSLKSQLDTLQTQLATGRKSTVYSGMGINEGFAIFARSQISNLAAFSTTMTNINTTIQTTNTALTSFGKIASQVKSSAGSLGAIVTGSGQTVGQQTATLQLKSMLEILNTQAGDRFLFSGSAIDTPSVASVDQILNGQGALAGLKQLIAERNQADLGASGLGRLVVSSPSPTSVGVAEDVAGSPFGFKLNAITSSLTGSTVDSDASFAVSACASETPASTECGIFAAERTALRFETALRFGAGFSAGVCVAGGASATDSVLDALHVAKSRAPSHAATATAATTLRPRPFPGVLRLRSSR